MLDPSPDGWHREGFIEGTSVSVIGIEVSCDGGVGAGIVGGFESGTLTGNDEDGVGSFVGSHDTSGESVYLLF